MHTKIHSYATFCAIKNTKMETAKQSESYNFVNIYEGWGLKNAKKTVKSGKIMFQLSKVFFRTTLFQSMQEP